MKTATILFSSLLLVSLTLQGVESVPGIRGKGAKIKGDLAYLCDTKMKPFDLKKGLTVSFWIKGAKWSHQAGIISGLGETAAEDLKKCQGKRFLSIEEVSAACPKVSKTHIQMLKDAGAFGDMPDTSQVSLF